MITNANRNELEEALIAVNEMFEDNVIFKEIKQLSKNRIQFTLRTKKSRENGSRISYSGRHHPSLCWHGHGFFFDALFTINENIFVSSRGKKITKDAGNWEDANIGSMMIPLMHSDACECAGSIDINEFKKRRDISKAWSNEGCNLEIPRKKDEHYFEYAKMGLKNGQLVKKESKMIDQSKLTSDCWLIQFNGLKECESCDLRNTDDCGGGLTLKLLKRIAEKDFPSCESCKKLGTTDCGNDTKTYLCFEN